MLSFVKTSPTAPTPVRYTGSNAGIFLPHANHVIISPGHTVLVDFQNVVKIPEGHCGTVHLRAIYSDRLRIHCSVLWPRDRDSLVVRFQNTDDEEFFHLLPGREYAYLVVTPVYTGPLAGAVDYTDQTCGGGLSPSSLPPPEHLSPLLQFVLQSSSSSSSSSSPPPPVEPEYTTRVQVYNWPRYGGGRGTRSVSSAGEIC